MRYRLKYLKSFLRHKWFVFLAACKLGIPLLGIVHDASKFTGGEFDAYANYFYGNKNGAAFDSAWNYHQKHNKHHWQYWVLINDRSEPQISALPMPERYIREMVADWRGAGRAYGNPDTLGWYNEVKHKQIMHLDTRKRVAELLNA